MRQPPPPRPSRWNYTSTLVGDPFEIARQAQALCGRKWRYTVGRTMEIGEFSCDSEEAMDEMKKQFPVED